MRKEGANLARSLDKEALHDENDELHLAGKNKEKQNTLKNDRNDRCNDLAKRFSAQKQRAENFAKRGIDQTQFSRLIEETDGDMETLKDVIAYLDTKPDNEGVIEFKFRKISSSIDVLEKGLSDANNKNVQEGFAKRKEQLVQNLENTIRVTEEAMKKPLNDSEFRKLNIEYQKNYNILLDQRPAAAKDFSPTLETSPTIKEILEKKRPAIEKAKAGYSEKIAIMRADLQSIIKKVLEILKKPNHKLELEILELQYSEKYDKLREFAPSTAKEFTKKLMENKELETATDIFLEDGEDFETMATPPPLPKHVLAEKKRGLFSRWGSKVAKAMLVIGAIFGLKGSPAPDAIAEKENLTDLNLGTKTSPNGSTKIKKPTPEAVAPKASISNLNIPNKQFEPESSHRPKFSEPEIYPIPGSDQSFVIEEVPTPATPTARTLPARPHNVISRPEIKTKGSPTSTLKEPILKSVEVGFTPTAHIESTATKLKGTYPRMNVFSFKRILGNAIENTIEGAPSMQKRLQIETLLTDAFKGDDADEILRSLKKVLENYNFGSMDIPSLQAKILDTLNPETKEMGGAIGFF